MRIIPCEQGSPEWHQARAGFATASRFSDILASIKSGEAAARRNYRVQLVVERLTGKVVNGYTNAAMQQGTEREPLARAAYSDVADVWVDQVGFCFEEAAEAGCSPDGLIGVTGGVEIKCPEPPAHLEYLRMKTAPSFYLPQIQGCMWITGRLWWDFVSWNPDFPERLQLVVRHVERDDTFIAGLQLAVSLFMSDVREEVAAL